MMGVEASLVSRAMQEMPIILVVNWVDPKKHIELYPAVLAGFTPKKSFKSPHRDFFAVDTINEAVELRTRIHTHIPVCRYRVFGDDDQPLVDSHGRRVLLNEPRVEIFDDSGGLLGG